MRMMMMMTMMMMMMMMMMMIMMIMMMIMIMMMCHYVAFCSDGCTLCSLVKSLNHSGHPNVCL